jgi:hypothetical protein
MSFIFPPATAAWRHQGSGRAGFEVAYFRARDGGCRIAGCTTAIDNGTTWAVEYALRLDGSWATREARIRGRSARGLRLVLLTSDGAGSWLVDGETAPHLDGCLDVDLESSALTNALPVHRMSLPVAGRAAAPAAYVRALDLAVERLEQTYARVADEDSRQCYDYAAPAFDFGCRLAYDDYGLVLDYPEIAVRAGLSGRVPWLVGRAPCRLPRQPSGPAACYHSQ